MIDKNFFYETELKAAHGGCPHAMNNVYLKLYKAMQPTVEYHFYNNALGREIIQDSIIKIFKRLDKINYKAMSRYAKRTASNMCIDTHRKNAIKDRKLEISMDKPLMTSYDVRTFKDLLPNTDDTSLYDKYNPDIVWEQLFEAINELSPAYKRIFEMFYLDEMSHEEISEELGICKGASKSNLFKARNNMRKKLGSYNGVLKKDFEPIW